MATDKKLDPMLQIVNAVSQKFLNVDKRLSDIVTTHMRDIIKAALGIKEEWGRELRMYETNGFKSELNGLVQTICIRDVKENAAACFKEMMGDKKFTGDITKLVQDKFEYMYRDAFRKELSRLVNESADGAAQQFRTECMELGKALDGSITPLIAGIRQRVLNEIAEKAARGERMGDHNSDF